MSAITMISASTVLMLAAAAAFGSEPSVNARPAELSTSSISAERLEQLKSLFPTASFRETRFQLTDEHVRMLKTMTDGQILKRSVSVYEARMGERPIGYISFFSAPEKGSPCRVSVSLLPNARIYKVKPFCFARDSVNDPGFLRQFSGKETLVESDWRIGPSVTLPRGSEDRLRPVVTGIRAVAAVLVIAKSNGDWKGSL